MTVGLCRCLIVTFFSYTLLFSGELTILRDFPAVLKRTGSPYLIKENITIPAGQTVIIEAGTILMFHEFAGLTVNGTLKGNGTSDSLIIFTSSKDEMYFSQKEGIHGAPFDWDGITISSNSSHTILKNVKVKYSNFGILSQSDNVILIDCLFKDNGITDLHLLDQKFTNIRYPYSHNHHKLVLWEKKKKY